MLNNSVRLLAVAVFLLASTSAAQAALKLSDPLPLGPQVKVGKLPNGLTYYIHKNGKPEKKLELRLVIKAGSIMEDDSQRGLAHFTEHMAFNGTTNFKKQELISFLQSIGVQFGNDLNAYTGFNETVYILPIPTDKKENVDKGFLMMRDVAEGMTMRAEDIDQERGVLLEENRGRKGAGERMQRVLLPKLFNGSRYAERLPIGKEEVLKNFKHGEIRRFYKDWYRPNLMAVVAVGDLDQAEVEGMIRKHFTDLKNPAKQRPTVDAKIAPFTKSEALVVTDKEANGNSVIIRYPVRERLAQITLGDYRAQLVESLFTGMLNQRLQELSQLANPPFLGAASSLEKMPSRQRSYSASAALGNGGAVPAINALIQENARASQFGFNPGELERAKKNLMRGYERSYAERDKTDSVNYVNEYVRNFLEQESLPGIENEFNYAKEMIPSITLEEMNAFARATIPSNSPKLVVYLGSSKTELPAPSNAELLAAVDAAEQMKVSANNEKALASQLMEVPPAAGRIVAESQDKQLGLTRLTLSNGVKVVLKPTDFRNDQVLMSASRFGGQSLFEEADRFNARYAHAVVSSMGLKDYAPLELQKILAGKTASVSTGMGMYTDFVSGNSGVADIETMLQFVHLRFTGARRDPDLFQSFVTKQVQQTRNALSQPEAVFQDVAVATLYKDHPRVQRVPRPDDFAKLDLDRSIAIYKERFSSAKGMTFVFTGSFDVEKIKPLLATYLASLPTGDIKLAFRDLGVAPVTGIVAKEVRSGTEPKSVVSITFSGPAQYSEEEQLRLQGVIAVMNLRINEVLREKLALIYSGSMGGGLGREPNQSFIAGIGLPTGPENVDKLLKATYAEITRLQTDGPTEAELSKVKQAWLQQHQKSMRENGYWMSRLQTSVLYDMDPATILTYEKRVNDMTAKDLRDAASRYLNLKNYVQMVLYPEKK
ncbi:MAG: insulinase family protein [Pseudomonadota bacterium]